MTPKLVQEVIAQRVEIARVVAGIIELWAFQKPRAASQYSVRAVAFLTYSPNFEKPWRAP